MASSTFSLNFGQPGEFLHECLVALTLCRIERDAGQTEISNGIVDDFALRRVEPRIFGAVGDLFIGLIECFVLAHLSAIFRQLGQARVIGGAQRFGIHDGIHMADR